MYIGARCIYRGGVYIEALDNKTIEVIKKRSLENKKIFKNNKYCTIHTVGYMVHTCTVYTGMGST